MRGEDLLAGIEPVAVGIEVDPRVEHAACRTCHNIDRGVGSSHDMAREAVNMICEDFVEMTPNREHNYCCGAGGGVINCGPPYKTERMVNNRVKAEQLKATGAEVLIAPCHNCHSGLEDIVHYYDLGMEIKFLGDIIYETMEKKIYKPGE